MEDELKDLEDITKHIDMTKVFGRYLLFGNFINDCAKNPEAAFKTAYYEFYTLHESFLAQYMDKPEFENVKKLLLELIDFLRNEVENLTNESIKSVWEIAIENAKENKNDIINHFSKKDYFV